MPAVITQLAVAQVTVPKEVALVTQLAVATVYVPKELGVITQLAVAYVYIPNEGPEPTPSHGRPQVIFFQ